MLAAYRVSSCVELGQQFSIDELLDVVDHEKHDGLGHQISSGFGHNLHVRVHEIADRLHLPLQLGVDGAQGVLILPLLEQGE